MVRDGMDDGLPWYVAESEPPQRETNSELTSEWVKRQWDRYDKLVEGFTMRGGDDTTRKAMCLAFVRSVLDDGHTDRLLSETLFRVTSDVLSECEDAVGTEKLQDTKVQLLLLLWSLPNRSWRPLVYAKLRDYFCRTISRPAIPFKDFLGLSLRALVRKIVDPLSAAIEPWL